MEFQNLIEKRRSVRKYVERNTVTKDEIPYFYTSSILYL